MQTNYQSIRRTMKRVLFTLAVTGCVIQFTNFTAGQEQSGNRPPRPEGQGQGRGGGGGRGGEGGGRREMPENKTPVSPNPGQTVGLFLNTPKACEGYTLICAGIVGHLFEVTPTGEMVWQYVNAMVRGGILAQGELPGKDMRGHLWNAVFKVHRYASDYPGLTVRDLTSKGVIELPASQKGKTGLDLMTEGQRTDRRPGGQGRGRGGQGGGNREGQPTRDDQRER